MRVSRYSLLFLTLLAVPSLLIPSIHPVAGITYAPGVRPGNDWTFAQLLCQGTRCSPFFTNISSVEFLVTSVSGPNVTLSQIDRYINGTSTSFNNTVNVAGGIGFSFLLLAGGLSAGNSIVNTTGPAPIINATITANYAGAPRTVNILELSNATFALPLIVWDGVTGILLEVRESFPGFFLDAKVTSTNIWPSSRSPFFDTSATVLPLTVGAGGSVTTTVSLESVNNFTGVVSEATALPAGLTATLSSASVLLSAGLVSNFTITVTTSPIIRRQLYFMTLTGLGGNLTDSAVVVLNVTGPGPRFGITASPSTLAFTVGSSASTTVTVTSFNGFIGTIALSAFASPAGPSTAFGPSSVSLSANGTATSTLTVGSAATGSFSVTVSGTHGSEVEQVTIRVVVIPSATLNSTMLMLQPNGSNSTTLTISTDPPLFTTPIAKFGSIFGSASVVTSSSTSTSGSNFTISASPNSTKIVQGSSVNSNITLKSVGPNHGGIELSVSVTDPAGVYIFTVTATNGTLTRSVNITVTVEDFVMNPTTPLVVPCTPGATCTTSIGATAVNGFAGQLSLTPTPSIGLAASLSTGTITVPGNATLSVSAPAVGNYTVTVTGTAGSLSHSTQTISVRVADFQLSATPPMVDTVPGKTASSTISVSPVNGFTSTVTLSNSISPSTGLTCSMTGNVIGSGNTISGGSGTAALACLGSGGSYLVTVTGASGSLSHSARVMVNVEDFTVSAGTAAITIPAGGSGSSSVTVTGIGGFSANVTLAANTPLGLSATLSPTRVVISGSSALTVMDSTALPGTYLVNVTGVSGSLSHSTTVTVIVVGHLAIPPSFSQMNWAHRLSLSKSGGVETWKFGVLNPNSNQTIYVKIQITASDGLGIKGFTMNSIVIALAPNKNLTNLTLSTTLPASDLGDTFTWTAIIEWGTTPSLGSTSSASQGVPTRGSFTVVS